MSTSINLTVTPGSDGFLLAGGTTARTLRLTGGNALFASPGNYWYTLPGANSTIVNLESMQTFTAPKVCNAGGPAISGVTATVSGIGSNLLTATWWYSYVLQGVTSNGIYSPVSPRVYGQTGASNKAFLVRWNTATSAINTSCIIYRYKNGTAEPTGITVYTSAGAFGDDGSAGVAGYPSTGTSLYIPDGIYTNSLRLGRGVTVDATSAGHVVFFTDGNTYNNYIDFDLSQQWFGAVISVGGAQATNIKFGSTALISNNVYLTFGDASACQFAANLVTGSKTAMTFSEYTRLRAWGMGYFWFKSIENSYTTGPINSVLNPTIRLENLKTQQGHLDLWVDKDWVKAEPGSAITSGFHFGGNVKIVGNLGPQLVSNPGFDQQTLTAWSTGTNWSIQVQNSYDGYARKVSGDTNTLRCTGFSPAAATKYVVSFEVPALTGSIVPSLGGTNLTTRTTTGEYTETVVTTDTTYLTFTPGTSNSMMYLDNIQVRQVGEAIIDLDGTVNNIKVNGANPKRSIMLTAAGGQPSTTNGCSAPYVWETATNNVDYFSLDYDATTEEGAVWNIMLPDNYDGSTFTANVYWTTSGSSDGVVWGIKGRAFGNDDALAQAFGDEVLVADTVIAAYDVHITSGSTAITLGGTPAGGEYAIFKVSRKTGDDGDTLAADARLLGVKLEYGINAYSD